MGVTVLHSHGELYRGGDCLYMANHRSWGDFFLDTWLTEGRAQLMSRMLVFYVFPVFMTSALIIKSLVLINRGNVGDKDRFNARLDQLRNESHAKGMVVYPEGQCTPCQGLAIHILILLLLVSRLSKPADSV